MKGLIFDIKEWAIYDGPGVRTTVFLKGCPLRCSWCHNPEGISFRKQLVFNENNCISCNRCKEICEHKVESTKCIACGKCVDVCPLHLRSITGKWYESDCLVTLLEKQATVLNLNNGGVTFSGGEPLFQHEFLKEVVLKLNNIHKTIETSGYAPKAIFNEIVNLVDYVIMDIKILDPILHQRYCGQDNSLILSNLDQLKMSGKPFVIRIPVIPKVNDSSEHYKKIAQMLSDSNNLQMVELLPYQHIASAKYKKLGMIFSPGFDTTIKPYLNTKEFDKYKIPVRIL